MWTGSTLGLCTPAVISLCLCTHRHRAAQPLLSVTVTVTVTATATAVRPPFKYICSGLYRKSVSMAGPHSCSTVASYDYGPNPFHICSD